MPTVSASSCCRAGSRRSVRMTAAKRRFSAHLFKAEKLCWCGDVRGFSPSVKTCGFDSSLQQSRAACSPRPAGANPTDSSTALPELCFAKSPVRTIRWSHGNGVTLAFPLGEGGCQGGKPVWFAGLPLGRLPTAQSKIEVRHRRQTDEVAFL